MLRSVNVGGRNRLAMIDLRELVSSLGFGDVSTYVQSGNVIFSGTGSGPAVARTIGSRMAVDLGLDVAVLVRTAPQLRAVLSGNPFSDTEIDPRTIHVTFLADRPEPGKVGALEALAGQSGDDRFEISDRHVYLHCPGGYGNTKLNNTYLERRLDVTATTRNWRTVTMLAGLAGVEH